jgi:hypothetical protein
MKRTILYKHAALVSSRINKQLKELATGDYSIDDTVRVYDALTQIEAVLNSLVVVNKAPTVQGLEVFETATPTIIKGERPKQRFTTGPSPLDMPHETDLKRRF